MGGRKGGNGKGKGGEAKGVGKGKGGKAGKEDVPGARCTGFKSERCMFFERGICKNGDLCTYAHGQEDLRSGGQSSRSDVKQVHRQDNIEMVADLTWLKKMKELPGQSGEEFLAIWKKFCAKKGVQDMAKHEWAAALAQFRASFDAGDFRTPAAAGEGDASSAGPSLVAEDSPSFTASSQAPFEPSPWLLQSAAAVRRMLEAARNNGALNEALSPSDCAEGEWQKLLLAGKQTLDGTAVAYAGQMTSSFFEVADHSQLASACCGATCLRVAFQLLRLPTLVVSSTKSPDEGELVTAVLGELESCSADLKSVGARARRALLDFLCLIGTALD